MATHDTNNWSDLLDVALFEADRVSLGRYIEHATDEFNDHPALAIMNKSTGFRAIVCWVSSFKNSANSFLQVLYSGNGLKWSDPRTLGGPNAASCTVGSSQAVLAVAWWDRTATSTSPDGTLKLRLSSDGATWSKQIVTLGEVGQLLESGTTDKVLSLPYAIPSPGSGATDIGVVWQRRRNSMSQIVLRASMNGLAGAVDSNNETFLPGAGNCGGIIGGYKVDQGSQNFRYIVWSTTSSTAPLFSSAISFDASVGEPDTPGPRIGDYTGVDCVGNTGVATWTDGRKGRPEVWAVEFPLN